MEAVRLGQRFYFDDESNPVRDAVHVALLPVICHDGQLHAGEHVGIERKDDDKVLVSKKAKPYIGIIDPFLTSPLHEGDGAYCMLYPGSIVSLRHEWKHPALDDVPKGEAEQWLRNFAENIVQMDYDVMIEKAKEHINTGVSTVCLNFDTPDEVYQQRETFWKSIQIVTGMQIQDAAGAYMFRCAC
jgi:hypothetical protein